VQLKLELYWSLKALIVALRLSKGIYMETQRQVSPVAKIIAALMAITFMGLGIVYIATGYVPAGWTKHGYVQAIYGENAKIFGAIMILIGLLPSLLFAKNARQASVLGTILGITLVAAIFIWVYAR
jgi:hypothetical protein